MNKIWKLKPRIPEELSSAYGEYDPLLAQLLYNRGLVEKDKIEEFLEPQYERLHSPFLFKGMEKAVERIWQAIDENQKITVYGDYDADAVTANAVLRQVFHYLNHQNIDSYIPDRFSEGYGLNLEALQKISDTGCKLIVTVDCGTNSVDAAEFCKKSGIDLIITDHHEIIGEAPAALALINPKNQKDNYPDPNITGVGVAFKLVGAILKNPKSEIRNPKLKPGSEKWLLDLVAIGTVADCHDLLGENRILVKYGLVVLQKTRWPGLRSLAAVSDLNFSTKPPDTYTLGFIIAPRLNAAGRLEHANIALDLLLEENLVSAQQKAQALNELNLRRQDTTARIMSEAREQALLLKDRKVLVLMNENWHKGVVGLVAGKIAEEFSRPSVVLQMEGLEATGSARTVGDFNVVEALKYSSKHLIRFGGHKQAAGLTLNPENFDGFYRSMLDYADQNLSDDDSSPVLELEAELSESQLSIVNCQLLSKLEPFGFGNVKPKFLLKNAGIVSQKQVGASGQHLQMQIKVGDTIIPSIAFNFRPVESSGSYDIACELMEDGWNGRKQLKLRVVDIKNSNILTS